MTIQYAASMAANCTDDAFGPWAGSSCRGGFDFTPVFEQSILMIAPTALFVSFSLPRLVLLGKRKTTTLPSLFRTTKLTIAAVFASLQLVLLILEARLLRQSLGSRVSVASAVVNLIASLHILALSWVEDARSVRPSSLITVYLLISLLFDVPQARTRWLLGSHTSLAAVFTASVAVKLVLLACESINKRRYLRFEYRSLPPESTSGILNRSVLWWLNDLFRRGYRTMLPFDALYVLDKELTSDALADKVARTWRQRRKPERRFEYPLAITRALWWPVLQVVIPRLLLIGFTFAQPFLITAALNLLMQPQTQMTRDQGYGLIGATALVYIGLAVSMLLFEHRLYRAITMFRGATVLLIHQHTLEIQDGAYDASAAITLMSTDTDSVIKAIERVNEIWARSIEVAVGIYLLARQLGWPCVVPLVAVLVSSGISSYLTKRIGGNQKKWVDAVQKRIALTSSVLSGMKSIKMMGLTRVLTSLIQEARIIETNLMAGFRSNIVWMNVAANIPDIWAPTLTFAVYAAQAAARGSGSIGTTQAFTSLAIIGLMALPAGIVVSSMVSVAASTGCFDRIQKFLTSPTLEDRRLRLSDRPSTSQFSGVDADNIELQSVRPNLSRKEPNTPSVRVEGANIRPVISADVLLQDVTFSIVSDSVTMMVGPVGSGKTTLLKAILGELPCETGSISVSSGRLAYCSQSSWLPNTTIRQAICGPAGGYEADERWYQATVKACALDNDFALLPEGDLTLIGTGSTVLSGGQKQRVALARAVYHRPDLALLDDVLSALDSRTKHHVVENLIGAEGLFRKLGTAVILVTHDAGSLRYADQTLVLSRAEGRFGRTYTQLASTQLADALVQIRTTTREDDVQSEQSSIDKPAAAPTTTAKKTDKGHTTRATGEFATYTYYFKSIGIWKALMFGGFCATHGFLMNFMWIWLKWWTDINGGRIGLYVGVYVMLSALRTTAAWGYVWSTLCVISPSTGRKLHYNLLQTVMRAPARFFSSTDSGSILNRFSQDMTLIESSLPVGLLITVSNVFMALGAAALVFTGSIYMAITMPFLLFALWCLQHVYLRTSRQLRLLDLEAKSPLYSHFLESIKGVVTIRAFGWQAENLAKNHRLLDHSQRPYYLLYCVQRWLNLVLDLTVAGMATLLIALAIGLRTNTDPGLLGVSMNSLLSFNALLTSIISGYTQLETSLGSIARLRDFEREVVAEAKEGEDDEPPLNWPVKGEIELRDVTLSHNPESVALHNISLTFHPGQRIGICGRTGSGKSSLLASLLRLLEIDSGDILIDGLSLSTIPRETIRERINVIPQDPLILVGSLRLNLDPSASHPDSALIAALRRVGLWDGILADRGGLDAEVSATELSLGQQQLLALARALLKREGGGKVLLLDEPTSNVDAETDGVIQDVLAEDFRGCTVVTVAHRLETILGSDVVVVLDAGRVVEVGLPGELAAREGGWFSGLIK